MSNNVDSAKKVRARTCVALFICAWIPIILTIQGCVSPTKKYEYKQDKVDAIEESISSNTLLTYEIARDYTYAADFTLSLSPYPDIYSDTAKRFTEKSLIATGLPGVQEANRMQGISTNLLSTNSADVVKGNVALKAKDAELAKIQSENRELRSSLVTAEAKLEVVNRQNAAMATTIWKIKNFFKWVGFGIGGLALVAIACAVLPIVFPVLAPLASLLGNTIGGMFKMVMRVVPAAANGAGVVAKSVFDRSEKTLSTLVETIQEVRDKDPAVKSTIDPMFESALDKDDKLKIIDVKTGLGYI